MRAVAMQKGEAKREAIYLIRGSDRAEQRLVKGPSCSADRTTRRGVGLRKGRALTEVERDMHDRGLVTLISQHRDAIDALVADAYGWPRDLTDEDILTRLVALNKECAAEEARGMIRYLRPEFQDPGYKAPVNETMEFGEAAVMLPANIIPGPKACPSKSPPSSRSSRLLTHRSRRMTSPATSRAKAPLPSGRCQMR